MQTDESRTTGMGQQTSWDSDPEVKENYSLNTQQTCRDHQLLGAGHNAVNFEMFGSYDAASSLTTPQRGQESTSQGE